uniref:Uncharacterized protein n=1 Tax=Haptolina ericina TaxID=156174 RepID=A0A7S3AFA1_9EUKA
MSVRANGAPSPDMSRGVWEVAVGGAWQPVPFVACREAAAAELPPPAVVRMEGATGSADKWNGLYKLQPGKVVKDRPVWQAEGPHAQYLAYNGFAWMVQGEASLGSGSGFMTVQDTGATPDLCKSAWSAPADGAWQPQPGVKCVALDQQFV